MSAPHPTDSHPQFEAPHNEDGVNLKTIVVVGVISLVVFILSAVVAWLIQRADNASLEEARGRAPIPALIGKAEIGLVDQVEFDTDRRLDEWRAAKTQRLSTYGWVDRSQGLIHVPIDKAMDEVVAGSAGAAPSGGQPQQP